MAAIVKKIGYVFWDLLQTVVMAAAIFVIGYLFVFQPHQVVGNSMIPNFDDKEYILTDKVSYRFHPPQRGDVIIFKAPPDPDREYIKRVIGLPGEKVKILGGKVYINGKELNEIYIPKDLYYVAGGSFLREGSEIQVPEGKYFVLGDNRSHSSDSREWGFVPQESIIGRAFFRYWPTSDIGLVPQTAYN